MAGVDLLRLDTKAVVQLAIRLEARMRELDAELRAQAPRDIGKELESSTQERFETKRSPDGERWPKWSEHYRPGKGSLLRQEDDLRKSVTHQVDDDDIHVGTPDERAATLQFGDRRLAWGRVTATWQPRPFVGISPTDAQDAEAILDDLLERAAS